uniref:SMODS and SLOG-associating 2TM effector domain-containing protein n=1 Tax=Marseillevirus LCMAC201 TaxID=2506605 RepID=A0A481YXF1_9VIRU|nr:MAG: uncharacterized protein LCMAC201_01460 [Marseillevirus LCMAC201]
MSSTNGWTITTEQLLRNWSQQISINENEYRQRGTYYRKWYYGIGVIIGLIQTSIICTLLNALGRNDSSFTIIIIITGLEAIVFIANGIDKFFNFAAGSEKFYEAAKEHNALSRLIDSTLAFPRSERDNARNVILLIRQQFNQIKDNSPNLPPNDVIHKLDMCIYENPHEARGNMGIGITLVGTETRISIKTPHNTENVGLPECSTGHDEEINNVRRNKFEAQLQEQKVVAKEKQEYHGILKNLEYQWGRMEQHSEDSTEHKGDE